MDAAYEADHLRGFIAEDLGAKARIKRNPSRRKDRPIGWMLYRERHPVECFFNRIKRFRRIALRCGKTVSSFKAFVNIACVMAWISSMQTPPGRNPNVPQPILDILPARPLPSGRITRLAAGW